MGNTSKAAMQLTYNLRRLTKTLFLTEEQQTIKPFFDLGCCAYL